MPSESDLLKAILANPDDDGPREQLADWCDQRATPPPDNRGEFIRLQLQAARGGPAGPVSERVVARQRERELLTQSGRIWAGPVARLADDFEFHRGLVALIATSAARFLRHADELFAAAPIQHLNLTEPASDLEQILASPHVRRLRSLSLADSGLGDVHAKLLADSPNLGELWWLDVSYNNVGFDGVSALAASKGLPRLQFVSFNNNPCNPVEELGVDGATISHRYLPDDGERLEAQFGLIPWLHVQTDSYVDYPPDRFAVPSPVRP